MQARQLARPTATLADATSRFVMIISVVADPVPSTTRRFPCMWELYRSSKHISRVHIKAV
eukprot:879388-Pleurochrysis_carterae.AAC.1